MESLAVNFQHEIEEVLIKQEPGEEWSDIDLNTTKGVKEFKEEIIETWHHELKVDENTNLVQSTTSMPQNQVECAVEFKLKHRANENKQFCFKKSDYKYIKNEHIYAKKWFNCEKCDYRATQRDYLRIHVISKHLSADKIKWFKCQKCPYRSKQKANLNTHVNGKHLPPEEMIWFKCEKCDFKTRNKPYLQHHVVNKHLDADEIMWFKCEKCNYTSKEKFDVNQHIISKHQTEDKISLIVVVPKII